MKASDNGRPAAASRDGAQEPAVARLAALIKAYAPHDGTFELRIPGVFVIRRSHTHADRAHVVQRSALCLIAQGAKSIMVGPDLYEYDPSRLVVFSVDMPVAAQVTRATPAEPYLGFRLDFDAQKVAALVLKVYPHGPPPVRGTGAVSVDAADPNILNAAVRLIELMGQRQDAELLGPLVIDEILIRLLRGPVGPRVAQIGTTDSGVFGVAKAVSWLRDNFSQPMKVDELAPAANMSVSSFHHHFKSVTSMSPLQYQKALRLQEARRLLLSPAMDAGTASRHVGYASPSQFSREYGRFFGSAPTRDVTLLREKMGSVAEE